MTDHAPDVDISIVVVNWNTKELLLDCLNAVYLTVKKVTFEVWVVDNGSTDGSVEAVKRRFPSAHVIANKKNLGFAAANNLAFRRMSGRYALLLNSDAILTEGSVESLHDFMEAEQNVAIACGQLLNPDGTKQNSVAPFPSLPTLLMNESVLRVLFPKKFPGKWKTYRAPIDVDSCIGACMIVRRAAMQELGLLDENYFFFFEETDWAKRMKQGDWRVCFVPSARILHLQGKSVGMNADARIMFYRSRYIYFKKWHPRMYTLVVAVIFSRLTVNTLLTLIGLCFTLGLNKSLKRRFTIYSQLIAWHMKGCP